MLEIVLEGILVCCVILGFKNKMINPRVSVTVSPEDDNFHVEYDVIGDTY